MLKLELNCYPNDPLEQVMEEILSIRKKTKSHPTTLAAVKLLLGAELDKRGFNRAVLRFAQKVFSERGMSRKSVGLSDLTRGYSAKYQIDNKIKGGGGSRTLLEQKAKVLSLIHKLMLVIDDDAIEILLGVAAAHELDRDAPWTFLVGPPSGGKNEFLNLFKFHPKAL